MRKFLIGLIAVLGIALLVGCGTNTYQLPAQVVNHSLSVAGQGKITVVPDVAYVTMGLYTEDVDAKIAQQKNAELMEKVIGALKQQDISKEDIKTINYSLSIKYEWDKNTGNQIIVGYTVTNMIQVTVRDLTKVGKVLDVATEQGINIANGIAFGLQDYESAYQKALENAINVAKSRADTIAKGLGVKLSTPYSVVETGAFYPVYRYANDVKEGGATTPIEAGTLEVTANVAIVYEIK